MLSVVLPVYNEEETIDKVLRNVLGVSLPPGVRLELIVVESNSNDRTRSVVQQYEADPRVSLVLQDVAAARATRSALGCITFRVTSC